MIQCYLLDGDFKETAHEDFSKISEVVEQNRMAISAIPLEAIIDILGQLGKRILKQPSLNQYQGISYISLWLRKDNLRKICELNYSNLDYLDHFTKINTRLEMYAQPRGIVCHWVAGNMPTLAFFSAVQAILSRNGSIIKVPADYRDLILNILDILNGIRTDVDGNIFYGADIVRLIAIVSFEGKNQLLSAGFQRLPIANSYTEALRLLKQ